jgi:predicted transcriptional regulator
MPQTRISTTGHRILRRLAEASGETSEQILDRALEAFERVRLLDAINAGYAALRGDPQAWTAERGERELWDTTLADGDPF